mmetsp:Transcript_11988/g.27689  ORF Transcript_11988/g.27689 Transcript_11988/m.27689 type:complete len:296 (-) Transcript_11988:337-1224(-)
MSSDRIQTSRSHQSNRSLRPTWLPSSYTRHVFLRNKPVEKTDAPGPGTYDILTVKRSPTDFRTRKPIEKIRSADTLKKQQIRKSKRLHMKKEVKKHNIGGAQMPKLKMEAIRKLKTWDFFLDECTDVIDMLNTLREENQSDINYVTKLRQNAAVRGSTRTVQTWTPRSYCTLNDLGDIQTMMNRSKLMDSLDRTSRSVVNNLFVNADPAFKLLNNDNNELHFADSMLSVQVNFDPAELLLPQSLRARSPNLESVEEVRDNRERKSIGRPVTKSLLPHDHFDVDEIVQSFASHSIR